MAVLWTTLAVTLPPSGSPAANFSLVVAFFGAAVSGHRRAAWAAIVAGYAAAVWVGPLTFGRPVGSLTFALLLGAWLAVLVVAAEAVRLRRERLAQARATRVADAQRQASEERLRMARDLHDVIGHNISLISVQAAVGLDLMDSDPEQARAALTAIKSVSREALDELRSMLAALRQAGEQPPTAPTPGLARLPELCAADPGGRHPGPDRGQRAGPAAAGRGRPGRVPHRAGIADQRGPARRTAPPRSGSVIRPGGVSVEVLDDGRGTSGR